MHDHCIRKIKLLPQEWQHLHQLAEETHSYTTTGPTARQVSWLALIRRIARGEIMVTERQTDERKRQLAALDRAIAENERTASVGFVAKPAGAGGDTKRLTQPQLFESEPA